MASKKKLTPAQKAMKNKLEKLTGRVNNLEMENARLQTAKDQADAFKESLKSFLGIDDLVDEVKEEIREGIDDQIRDEVDSRISDLTIS